MNKITQLIFGVLVIGLLTFDAGIGFKSLNREINNNLGVQLFAQSPYFGATNGSSSVPTVATTTSPILSLDNTRTNALICNNSANTVFLHQNSQATTTGVVVNEGIPLFGVGLTTSTEVCQQFPGFKGYLYGISAATSNITVSSWK